MSVDGAVVVGVGTAAVVVVAAAAAVDDENFERDKFDIGVMGVDGRGVDGAEGVNIVDDGAVAAVVVGVGVGVDVDVAVMDEEDDEEDDGGIPVRKMDVGVDGCCCCCCCCCWDVVIGVLKTSCLIVG